MRFICDFISCSHADFDAHGQFQTGTTQSKTEDYNSTRKRNLTWTSPETSPRTKRATHISQEIDFVTRAVLVDFFFQSSCNGRENMVPFMPPIPSLVRWRWHFLGPRQGWERSGSLLTSTGTWWQIRWSADTSRSRSAVKDLNHYRGYWAEPL